MVNNVVLIGRLTHEPKDNLKQTPAGHQYIWNSVAVENTMRKHTNFIPIKLWNKQAEYAANYLEKGRLVAIEGSLNVVSTANKVHFEIDVREIKSLEAPKATEQQQNEIKEDKVEETYEAKLDDVPWDLEL